MLLAEIDARLRVLGHKEPAAVTIESRQGFLSEAEIPSRLTVTTQKRHMN
jgi:hypothetical protein